MAGGSPTELSDALDKTDRRLRRLLRTVTESNPNPGAELEREIKLIRRQLRANRALLDRDSAG